MTNKDPSSPAYQWYPAEYLADMKVQALTLLEEGAYNRLLNYCWREGSLPDDVDTLRALCKMCDASVLVKPLECFQKRGDRYYHKRHDKERLKQKTFKKERSTSGKKGAKVRWAKGLSADGSAIAQPMAQPMANDSSSSSSLSSSSNTHAESVDDFVDNPDKPKLQHDTVGMGFKLWEVWKQTKMRQGANPHGCERAFKKLGEDIDIPHFKACLENYVKVTTFTAEFKGLGMDRMIGDGEYREYDPGKGSTSISPQPRQKTIYIGRKRLQAVKDALEQGHIVEVSSDDGGLWLPVESVRGSRFDNDEQVSLENGTQILAETFADWKWRKKKAKRAG